METVAGADVLRERIAAWRRAGEAVAFVPTMGNLHRGHLRLVERARELAPRVVASVFVNPLQFGPNEDFAAYPRTLAADQAALEGAGTDLLFAPAVETLYPGGTASATRVTVPELETILCGAFRPGHFTGVATVVAKLFNLVAPDVAVFGEKDYQQLVLIRRMAVDLCWPIEVVGVATERDADGLAMSSRNAYLSDAERARAPALYRTLQAAAGALAAGADIAGVEQTALAALVAADLAPEYVSVRRAADLTPPAGGETALVVLAAVRLGRARLIDNILVSVS